MNTKHLLAGLLWLACATAASAASKVYTLTSPSGNIEVTATTDAQGLTWAVKSGSTQVLLPSAIQAVVDGKHLIAATGSVAKKQMVESSFATPVYRKQTVDDRYGLLVLKFGQGTTVEFRAYDDGAAYRIGIGNKKAQQVDSETVEYCFADDYQAFVPYVNDLRGGERYSFSFESYYDEQRLSTMFPDSMAITPLAVCMPKGQKAVVMDAGVEDYPGMMLKKGKGNSLVAEFAPWVLEQSVLGRGLNMIADKRAPYIAKLSGPRMLPWRAVVVTQNDAQLLTCDMAMRLAPASRLADTSWIKPGKVAWDWWNNTNVWGVDFESGMNTATYKYYIDFAQKNHLEYIIIDEGWSGRESLIDDLNPAIDLPALVQYGNSRGVGIILWSSWRNMIGNDAMDGSAAMERYMKHYAEMGIKGFKVDFFDRDDQQVIASAYRMAECGARHHLLLDYHGLKPMGLNRTWPNVLNFEGVKGLENAKWEPRQGNEPQHDQPRYDVTIPYLRMLCGPLDYTPGAMDNATRENFFGNNGHPMSQGTRCHQMAMYVIFDAPLQMLADSPTKYMREQESTDFIRQIPTTFDESVAIGGELGEYVAIARRKGSTWYVAAMTNWTPRTLTLDLSFLSPGNHQANIFSDGVNALREKEAMDYKHTRHSLKAADKLNISMAPGGGWVAIIN
ncbi:MAG: glycoside hydrolase family 97 protein [Prevotella sp.]|nr:glycoside hydrolase family 97 protein [Prevotella sp.]